MTIDICAELGLLAEVGDPVDDPGRAWAGSGLVPITGDGTGREQIPAGLEGVARLMESHWRRLTGGSLDVLALASARVGRVPRPGVDLVAEGCTLSWGGATGLLRAADGLPIALALPRVSDWQALPAVFECPDGVESWSQVVREVASHRATAIVERARLLAVAASSLRECGHAAAVRVEPYAGAMPRSLPGLRVVDLSALWAGPLCARLLSDLGAVVVKVEDPSRPDGARGGDLGWFDDLHGGHLAVAIEMNTPRGREQLRQLLRSADVVIEGSRPRALAQMGIDAREVAASGVIWVSITAHGRGEAGDRVGFGDDAALAGGLTAGQGDSVTWLGDAVADPLTGSLAALCTVAAACRGGGYLIELALARTAALAADPGWGSPVSAVGPIALARPMAPSLAPAPGLGEHQDRLASLVAGRWE